MQLGSDKRLSAMREIVPERRVPAYAPRTPDASHARLHIGGDLPSSTLHATVSAPITELLAAARDGDIDASDSLARAVHAELRALAASYLRKERDDHTLQPTALVNEAYLRLLGQSHVQWKSRAHFFGIAAQIMRRLLVDHARRTRAQRRDGGRAITLDETLHTPHASADDVLGVHDALERLAVLDARQARVVELKFFMGLTLEEIADVLDISTATVSREWMLARAWLHQTLQQS